VHSHCFWLDKPVLADSGYSQKSSWVAAFHFADHGLHINVNTRPVELEIKRSFKTSVSNVNGALAFGCTKSCTRLLYEELVYFFRFFLS